MNYVDSRSTNGVKINENHEGLKRVQPSHVPVAPQLIVKYFSKLATVFPSDIGRKGSGRRSPRSRRRRKEENEEICT
jgi:hypothetical protein